jgi:hypothetical protein
MEATWNRWKDEISYKLFVVSSNLWRNFSLFSFSTSRRRLVGILNISQVEAGMSTNWPVASCSNQAWQQVQPPAAIFHIREPASLLLARNQRSRPLSADSRRQHSILAAGLGDKAQYAAKAAQQRLADWAKEQEIDQKMNKLGKEAKKIASTATEEIHRKVVGIDREYNMSERAERVAERVKEKARDMNSKYGISRRWGYFMQDLPKVR